MNARVVDDEEGVSVCVSRCPVTVRGTEQAADEDGAAASEQQQRHVAPAGAPLRPRAPRHWLHRSIDLVSYVRRSRPWLEYCEYKYLHYWCTNSARTLGMQIQWAPLCCCGPRCSNGAL